MYYFIINPEAAGGHCRPVWAQIRRVLHQRNIPHKVFATKHSGNAAEMAAWIAERDPEGILTVVGGDGTVHEVLSGIRSLSDITLGIIPNGSGNDFAKSLGIHEDPLSALEAILNPTAITRMDVGIVTSSDKSLRFGGSAGIGLDAAVGRELMSSHFCAPAGYVGVSQLTSLAIAGRKIPLYDPCSIELKLDGGRVFHFPKTYFVAVMNLPFEGGGLKLCPEADPTDGILDILVCSGISKGELLAELPLAGYGKHLSARGLHFLRCNSVEVQAERKLPIHLDGESGGISTVLSAELEHKALKVIVR